MDGGSLTKPELLAAGSHESASLVEHALLMS
jgi:hypothetical protein